MTAVLALSLSSEIEKYGAYAGIAAVVGLGVLSLLYFAQAREVKRLREWAGRAPERDADLQQRVVAEAQTRTVAPSRAQPPRPAGPATPAGVAAAAPAAAGKPVAPGPAVLAAHPGTPTGPKPPVPATAAAAAAVTATGATVPAAQAGAAPPAVPAPTPTPTPVPAAPLAGASTAAPTTPAATPDAPAGTAPAPPAAAPPATTPPPVTPAATPPAAATTTPPTAAPAAVAPPTPGPPRPRPRPAAAPVRASRPEAGLPSRAAAEPPQHGSRRGLWGVIFGGVAIAAVAVILITQVFSGGDDGGTTTKPNSVGTPTATTGNGTAAKPQPDRAGTRVAVFNGTPVSGLARAAADKLTAVGYRDVSPVATDTTNQTRATTVVFWQSGTRREGLDVAKALGLTRAALQVMDQNARVLGGGAPVVVVVGADQAQ